MTRRPRKVKTVRAVSRKDRSKGRKVAKPAKPKRDPVDDLVDASREGARQPLRAEAETAATHNKLRTPYRRLRIHARVYGPAFRVSQYAGDRSTFIRR